MKYQWAEMRKPVLIFYGIIVSLLVIATILNYVDTNGEMQITAGFEPATMIFLFILGLNLYTSSFKMFLQNGISRMSAFKGFATSSVIAAIVVAAVDVVIGVISKLLLNSVTSSNNTLFSILYGAYYENAYSLIVWLTSFLWLTMVYAFLLMAGLLLRMLLARWRYWVWVVVGGTLFIDSLLLDGVLYRLLKQWFFAAVGLQEGNLNPYLAMVTLAISTIILAFCQFLMIRRAVSR